jgi:hypothetical protein
MIFGGPPFADRLRFLGDFFILPEAVAAPSCEGALPEDADPPQIAIGERLFLETRFAQFFFANSHGNANAVLAADDPVMDGTQTTGDPQHGSDPRRIRRHPRSRRVYSVNNS